MTITKLSQEPDVSRPSAGAAGVRFEVLDARSPHGRRRWEEAWSRSGQAEIFVHPEYIRAVALDGELPMCAVMQFAGGAEIYYAFIVRPIRFDAAGEPVDEELFDIYTPLVYGGPLSIDASGAEVAEFWDAMAQWARAQQVVSEIIRFTPVERHRLEYSGVLREQAPHIVIDLEGLSEGDVIARLHKSVRRYHRKLLAEGATLKIVADESGIDDFVELHAETMRRRGAHSKFDVEPEFLRILHRIVPGQLVYVFACRDGRPMSAELVVLRGDSAHAYLAGSRTEALKGNFATLAGVGAILVAREHGCHEYVLAGGITNTVDDDLLKFKRRFTDDGDRQYFTGEQVFLQAEYDRLCATPSGVFDAQGFFPAYRARQRAEDGHSVPSSASGNGNHDRGESR